MVVKENTEPIVATQTITGEQYTITNQLDGYYLVGSAKENLPPVPGDVDRDGIFTDLDAQLITNYTLNKDIDVSFLEEKGRIIDLSLADLNNDNRISSGDAALVSQLSIASNHLNIEEITFKYITISGTTVQEHSFYSPICLKINSKDVTSGTISSSYSWKWWEDNYDFDNNIAVVESFAPKPFNIPAERAITFFIEPHISVPMMSFVVRNLMYRLARACFVNRSVSSFSVAKVKPAGILVTRSTAKDGPLITAMFFVSKYFLNI